MINQVKHINLKAVYAAVPSKQEFTMDYPQFNEQEAAVFIQNTGVHSRRVAPKELTCADLCFEAALRLLEDFDVSKEIDLLVFVSQSPDYFLPATAAILQDRLGLSTKCLAFDVNLGCSGYVYGLNMVAQFIESGAVNKALLLVGDKSTISTSPEDKTAFPLFGDAGTASLLCRQETESPWFFHSGTDGSGKNAIIIEGGHSRNPYGSYEDLWIDNDGIKRSKSHLFLDGLSVFNFALKRVPESIEAVMKASGQIADTIDFFILHQANALITKTVARKMKVEPSKFLSSIESFGNTSSASIPLTLVHAVDQLDISRPNRMVFSGFGVGFSWATVCLNIAVPKTKLLNI